jgi:hypothetical protein
VLLPGTKTQLHRIASPKEQIMIKRMELYNTAWSQGNIHIEQYQQGKKDLFKNVYFPRPNVGRVSTD